MRDTLGLGEGSKWTLVDVLQWRARNEGGRTAYICLADGEKAGAQFTYAALHRRAAAIAAALAGRAGERALLLHPPGLEFVAAFVGCLYAGILAVPAYPPRRNAKSQRLQAIAADAGVSLVLTESAALAACEAFFSGTLESIATDCLPEALCPARAVQPADTAFLQYTSGSAGDPKGVIVSHANLMHNLATIRTAFGHTSESRGVIWLPPYHDMGLIGGILQPAYAGFPVVLLPPAAFLQRPVRWLEAITRYRATTSGGPGFAYELCVEKIRRDDLQSLDLSSWEVAFNGAEPVRAETMDRFAGLFQECGFRPTAFYPCYGLAEGTLMVSGGRKSQIPVRFRANAAELGRHRVAEADEQSNARTYTGCGGPWLGQEVRIVDPRRRLPCTGDAVGEIWVRGPSISAGYWNRERESRRTFGGYLADSGAGPFLRTGDLGFLRNGELFITGRLKEIIIVRGQNHYPADIEATVASSHAALLSGAAAAFSLEGGAGEGLAVAAELRRTHLRRVSSEVETAIRGAIASVHQIETARVVLVKPGGIPKTPSGKVRRGACRTALLRGELMVLNAPPQESRAVENAANGLGRPRAGGAGGRERSNADAPLGPHERLRMRLRSELAHVLGKHPAEIDVHQPINTMGLDSLRAVDLGHRIWTELGVEVPAEALANGADIAALAELIDEQGGHEWRGAPVS